MIEGQVPRAVVDFLWNRLHHGAWERHRVVRTIDKANPGNPYTPRPKVGSVPRPPSADLVDEMHASARILGAVYPEDVPGLAAPLAVELRREAYEAFLAHLTPEDRATLLAAIEAWPHAYELRANRHGARRLRASADEASIALAHGLIVFARVVAFDEGDVEPAFISEGDLLELERIAREGRGLDLRGGLTPRGFTR